MFLGRLVFFSLVVEMSIAVTPLMMSEKDKACGEFSCPVGGSVAGGRVEEVVVHNLNQNFGYSALEE